MYNYMFNLFVNINYIVYILGICYQTSPKIGERFWLLILIFVGHLFLILVLLIFFS